MINKLKHMVLLLVLFTFYQCADEDKPIEEPVKKPIVKPVEKIDETEYDFVFDGIKSYFGNPLKSEYANKIGNEYSKEKVALGEKLYNEKRLSKDNTVSCASCHDLKKGGTDNLPNSKGIIGKDGQPLRGDRNAPSVINAALHFRQFWDGRAEDVEEQAGGPILNPIEMGMTSKEDVEQKIRKISEYKSLFKKAFPKETEPITFKNIRKAIASFERTLIKPSRFDRFVAGDIKALNRQEKMGLHLFKYNTCTACHSGILLGGERYKWFGMTGNYWDVIKEVTGYTEKEHDLGRYSVTGEEGDKYLFKVPSLRNVEKTFPYFHNGSVTNLKDAIKIMGKAQRGVNFTDEQIDAIEAFLKTLTSED